LGAQILWLVFQRCNDLLYSSTDILIWDDIFGKSFKESLEGCNNSVTDGEDMTATMQETVIRVSSSNLSFIDDNGELGVSSCSGRFSKKQLPSLFLLVVYG
jgi:hypothetical protein